MTISSTLLGLLLSVTAVFLILIVLVQRGRGGGLTGALGGMGGQSAFGAKAGDVFTRITVGTAAVWIVLCVLAVRFLGSGQDKLSDDLGTSAIPQGEALFDPQRGADDPTEGAMPGPASGPQGPVPNSPSGGN
jgi:preprotein translocase subunit SecG